MKKISTKLLCVILSVTMLIMSLPMYAFAIDLSSEEASQDVSTSSDRTAQIIELTEKRTSDTKHFKLEDGSYYVAQYQTAVHYLDEDGNWQDIDNTLTASGSEISTSNAKIKFVKKTPGNGSIFTLHDGNRKLELTLNGAEKKVEGQITNYVTEHGEDATELQKMTTLDKVSASVLYADILPDTDLEYIVNGLNIKENIIVKAKGDAYSYSFTMSLNNLNATLNAKGEILITDSSSGNTVYTIPTPIMWDASDTFSDAVTMSLASLGNGKYTLTVTADSEWMNATDRVYPVTIDPPIYGATGSNVTDITVNTSDPTDPADTTDQYLYVSNTKNAFWKTTALPKIPDSAYITSAHIQFYGYSYESLAGYIAVYEVTSDWDETLTWEKTQLETNPQGVPAEIYTDTFYVNITGTSSNMDRFCNWTITPIVKKWYADPTNNYGIMLASLTQLTAGHSARFLSNDHADGSFVPRLGITYQDMKGVESYWSYSSQSAGFAGSGAVNNATGNLVVSIPTLTTTDALMPITPTLIYNSVSKVGIYDSSVLYSPQSVYPSTFMPNGFSWNICETIAQSQYINQLGQTCTMFTWTDGDGTEHCFVESSTEGEYNDIDGLHLTLTSTETGYKITDSGYNVREFSTCYNSSNVCTGWYLSDLYDQTGNRLQIVVDSAYRPVSIKLWPVGATTGIEQMRIAYNSAGVPCAVWNPISGDGVAFRYSSTPMGSISSSSGGYLRQVIRGHGSTSPNQWLALSNNSTTATSIVVDATATYSYVRVAHHSLDEYYVLNSIINELSQYWITYHFDNSGRVIRVQEHVNPEDSQAGQMIEFTYGVLSTVIQTSGTDDEFDTSDDLYTTYGFDSSGRTVSCYTTDSSKTQLYGASNGQYVGDENEKAKNNLKSSVQTVQQASNYILNGGFEYSAAHWTLDSCAFIATSDTFAYQGQNALGLTVDDVDCGAQAYQYVTLDPGNYTLSMQVDTAYTEDGTVYVKVESQINESNVVEYRVPIDEYNSTLQYTEICVEFSAISASELFKITIAAEGSPTEAYDVYVDNVMLSKTIGPAAYDLVNNGHFELGETQQSFWYLPNTDTTSIYSIEDSNTGPFYGNLKISANVEAGFVYQEIYKATAGMIADNDAGEYTDGLPMLFTVSGFGKGTAAYGEDSSFGISVEVKYYRDGEISNTETFDFDFNRSITDWQFTSGTFVTNPDYGMVHTITVRLCYSGNPVDGYFDNISVTRDSSTSNIYSYNPEGYLSSHQSGRNRSWYYYKTDETTGKTTNLVERVVNLNYTVIDYKYNSFGQISYETYSRYSEPYNPNQPDALDENMTEVYAVDYRYTTYGQLQSIYMHDCADYTVKSRVIYSYNYDSGSHIFGTTKYEADVLGNFTYYYYDSNNGRILATIYPEGNGVYYEYDAIGNLTKVLPASANETTGYVKDEVSASVGYNYSSTNDLIGITTESTKYNFTYDEFGNTIAITVGDTVKYTLATYSYADNNGKLQTLTYGNGLIVRYLYDALDRISQIQYNIGADGAYIPMYSYEYDTNGNLHSVEDHRNGRVTVYAYDHESRLINTYEYDSETYLNEYGADVYYDDSGRVSYTTVSYSYGIAYSKTEIISNSYSYNDLSGNLERMSYSSNYVSGTIDPVCDNLGKTKSKIISFKVNNVAAFYAELEYDYKASTLYESGLVSQVVSKIGQSSTGTLTTTTYNYTYDKNGNITQITDASGVIQNRYEYDDLGQLTREDNRALNKSYVWTYDNAGNILSKKTYAFTTGVLGTATSTINYTYGNTNWGDLLTKYGNTTITYDTIGNPITIGGDTYDWEGRQLISRYDDYEYVTYTYNADGLRISKEYGEFDYHQYRHEYTLNGTQIVKETVYYNEYGDSGFVEDYTLVYIYDESGAPIGMKYREPSYAGGVYDVFFFEKNLQGDIVSVYNSTGEKVLSYTYDAWGNFTQTYVGGTQAQIFTAQKNPFRYRGYYYDADTGLYYLQSRYYNPQWGRFINSDGVAFLGANQDMISYNLFAYCSNNPINYKQRSDFSFASNTTSNLSVGQSASKSVNSSAVEKNESATPSSNRSKIRWFGCELRTSAGWENSSSMVRGGLGTFGISSYTTYTEGQSGIFYVFAGRTSDVMNLFGTTYCAGYGINLFDFIVVEYQLETLGRGTEINIGDLVLGVNVNLIGETSIKIGWNTDLDDGGTKTDAVTIGINSAFLASVILGVRKLFTIKYAPPVRIPIPCPS